MHKNYFKNRHSIGLIIDPISATFQLATRNLTNTLKETHLIYLLKEVGMTRTCRGYITAYKLVVMATRKVDRNQLSKVTHQYDNIVCQHSPAPRLVCTRARTRNFWPTFPRTSSRICAHLRSRERGAIGIIDWLEYFLSIFTSKVWTHTHTSFFGGLDNGTVTIAIFRHVLRK